MKSVFLTGLLVLITNVLADAQPTPARSAPLETVAEFGRHQGVGVGVSKQERIFVTFPKTPAHYDPARAALVVLDLKTGRSRTLLENDKSAKADPTFILTIDGKGVIDAAGHPFSSNVNGIALTDDFTYLYYRPITQTKLFRIATVYLNDPSRSAADVASHVGTVAETGVSHGMISDARGNVYLTDSPNKAIRYVTPGGASRDRAVKTLVQDDRLLWPDSFAIGPGGYLYVTAAQLHRIPRYNNGQDTVDYPFRLYQVRLRFVWTGRLISVGCGP